jgi:Protein of unknown function (DUF4232)
MVTPLTCVMSCRTARGRGLQQLGGLPCHVYVRGRVWAVGAVVVVASVGCASTAARTNFRQLRGHSLSAGGSEPRTGDGAAKHVDKCEARQLTASLGQHGPANGSENVVIVLRNTSATACRLGGLLPLSATDDRGVTRDLHFEMSSDPAVAAAPRNSDPGPLLPKRYGAFIVTECLTAGTKCAATLPHYVSLHIRVDGALVDMPYPDPLRLGPPGTEGVAQPVRSRSRILGG